MRVLWIVLILSLLPDCLFAQKKNIQAAIDLDKSVVEWTGKKLTGEHYGEIKLSSANLVFEKNRLVGGSFEMDMNSIVCTDITDAKSNKRLIDHLKSDDFFSTSKFPKAKFEITRVEYKSEANYIVTGNLMIKEKTNPLSFPIVITFLNGTAASVTASMIFDRSKYDVKFGSQSFFDNLGDKLVYDDIEIKVKLLLTSNYK